MSVDNEGISIILLNLQLENPKALNLYRSYIPIPQNTWKLLDSLETRKARQSKNLDPQPSWNRWGGLIEPS